MVVSCLCPLLAWIADSTALCFRVRQIKRMDSMMIEIPASDAPVPIPAFAPVERVFRGCMG
jgi:hypothetical protein